jgi:NAD-dependent deacetylase
METYNEKIRRLASWIKESKRLCVFTGAGISCPSGIPDFRSGNGLYATPYGSYPPETMLSHDFFVSHTEEFYRFYREKMIYRNAKPNAAHLFFAGLESETQDVTVVTQNIDGLHAAAGSNRVFELHGSIHRNICQVCGKTYGFQALTDSPDAVPACPDDGGILKPDVVLYGEQLDPATVDGALNCISEADTLIVAGTSLNVYPAASFITYYSGTRMALINRSGTAYDSTAGIVLHEDIIRVVGDIGKIL